MGKNHLNLLISQWQGGGQDKSTYLGGIEIRDKYMQDVIIREVKISMEDICEIKNNIRGYSCIYDQLKQAKDIIEGFSPKTIFTVGGGCDVDIIPLTYLNKVYNNEITILWFDAHADLHTPETSESHLFYGMPLRLALGEGDKSIIKLLGSKIQKSQLMMLGTREIDKAEKQFINDNFINVLTCNAIENDLNNVIGRIKAIGNKKLYLHLDLDVVEPTEFPYVPVPAKDGLKLTVFATLISELHKNFEIVGLGMYEYNATAKDENWLIKKLVSIGKNL